MSGPCEQKTAKANQLTQIYCSRASLQNSNQNSKNAENPAAGGSAAAIAAATAAALVANAAALDGGVWGKASVDIPGEYHGNHRPSPELHSKLVSFGSVVETVRRGGAACKRIAMRGSDGKLHYFVVELLAANKQMSDERARALFGMLNVHVFARDGNCNRRNCR